MGVIERVADEDSVIHLHTLDPVDPSCSRRIPNHLDEGLAWINRLVLYSSTGIWPS